MDYLDTKKQSRHQVLLFVGYILVAVAIVTGTLILLYQAYGFGIGKNGTVIQNGLTFFSSHPHPANIYINNRLESVTTNTRLSLPAGIYHVKFSRDGYRDWQRVINLEGGSVEHFDYPFLFPKSLTTKKIRTYVSAPGLLTQSPDRRWLLIQEPGSVTNFSLYDLKNPDKAPAAIALPANLLAKTNTGGNWQFDEWADDNRHVLLRHNYDGKTEFILLDRADLEQSLSLNSSLGISPAKLTLRDKKYDQYYVYTSDGALQAASLKSSLTPVLQQVLAYQSYGKDTLLYVTADSDNPGKVLVKLRTGDETLDIRRLPADTTYLVDLTKYDDVMYVAAGEKAGNKVYIYKDPAGQLARQPEQAIAPKQVLRVPHPDYLSFSPTAQFIFTSNGNYFGVYDIENDRGYNYTTPEPLDPPQTHAAWMDGNRLLYTSGGRLVVFDYDGTNHQALVPASGRYLPAFAPDYEDLYVLTPTAAGQVDLTQTSLLTPADR